jgi:aminoglycoside phosphotransferase (APT) family kinase protein
VASPHPRTPFALAALACAAIKGMEPVWVRAHPQHDPDIDAALVEDSIGREWVVRSPRTAAAGARMETEARLVDAVHGWVTFAVPRIAGHAALPEGGRALVHRAVAGNPVSDEATVPRLIALGRALAVVHDLPTRLVADAGMPVYEADEYRRRRLVELDRAAATGHVPPRLLGRWEKALEEAGAWRFVPCVVHGEFDGQSVLVQGNEVSGVVDWAQARVADPADDLAWLANAAEPASFEAALKAYTVKRRITPDGDLVRRARLAGELSLIRWLLHGVSTDDQTVIADAVDMLTALQEALATAPDW